MPLIHGLKPTHPAVLLFALNVILGSFALCIERNAPGFLLRPQKNFPIVLLFIGLLLLSWSPLYIIARPEEWLPVNWRYRADEMEVFIQRIGYLIAISLAGFFLYRIIIPI